MAVVKKAAEGRAEWARKKWTAEGYHGSHKEVVGDAGRLGLATDKRVKEFISFFYFLGFLRPLVLRPHENTKGAAVIFSSKKTVRQPRGGGR
jgi:hypothetical protein